MIFEYIRLTGMGGSPFSVDIISRVLFLAIAGLLFVVVGFKVKGIWGAAAALAAGAVLLLINEGIIRF